MSDDIGHNLDIMSESSDYNSDDIEENNVFEKQQNELKAVIEEISKSIISEKNKFEYAIKEINNYIDKYERFLYSSIYSFVGDMNHDDSDTLISNLWKIYEYSLNELDGLHHDNKKNIFKLYDYVNLAVMQKDRLNDMKEVVLHLEEESKNVKSTLDVLNEESSRHVDDFEKSKSKFYDQLIAAMAIFISLAFIIFGGISSLTGLSDPLVEVIKTGNNSLVLYKAIIIWAIALTNLLSLFIVFMSSILDKKFYIGNIYIATNVLLVVLLIIMIICS